MKNAIVVIAIVAALSTGARAQEELGLNVVPASANSAGREAAIVTYTGLESPEFQLYELEIPAATETECFAATDFVAAVAIPASRTGVHLYQGKKVTIVMRKGNEGPCTVILGRSGTSTLDFNLIRANFGPTAGSDRRSVQTRQTGHITAGPKFSLTRHFD